MSRLAKSTGIAFLVVAAWTLYAGFQSIAITGSGGLGSVSFGVSEALVELLGLTAIVWIVLFLRSRFGRKPTPTTRH